MDKLQLDNNEFYQSLLQKIGKAYDTGKRKAATSVNEALLQTYWKIGQYIVEFEQEGNVKAAYGKQLLIRLAKDLRGLYGKGFSRSNLYNMRLFYLNNSKIQTVSGRLSWSHHVELLSISNDLERQFYQQQTIRENWSVRELKRQRKTALFQRLALSKDKKGILRLAKEGQRIADAKDLVKDAYVFEFLGFSEQSIYSERILEKRLLDKLQQFLLELGKGFAF